MYFMQLQCNTMWFWKTKTRSLPLEKTSKLKKKQKERSNSICYDQHKHKTFLPPEDLQFTEENYLRLYKSNKCVSGLKSTQFFEELNKWFQKLFNSRTRKFFQLVFISEQVY